MKNIEIAKSNFGTFKGFSNDYLFKKLKSGEAFSDERIVDAIKDNVSKSSVCIDIGANIGILTCFMANLCKKVLSFEPQKVVFDLLQENVNLNNLTNCQCYNLGCFSESAKFKIAPQEKQDGYVGDISRGYDNINSIGSICLEKCDSGDIDCVRVDELISERIDFIKVDAEGADIDALIGCEKIIKKYKPKIICEFGAESSKNFNRSLDDYYDFCKNNSYRIYRIDQANLFLCP